MNAPNRSSDVAAWVNSHRFLFVGGGNPDDIRRELLVPLAQYLNQLEGRDVWGRLVKSDRTPPFIPHDILMWKDTREHFDVFTGAEEIEDTQPSWGENPPPDDPRWIWQGVGMGSAQPPAPTPDPEPDDSDADIAELKARVHALEVTVNNQAVLIVGLGQENARLAERVLILEEAPAPTVTIPPMVARGFTSRVFGHAHVVVLNVEPKGTR